MRTIKRTSISFILVVLTCSEAFAAGTQPRIFPPIEHNPETIKQPEKPLPGSPEAPLKAPPQDPVPPPPPLEQQAVRDWFTN